MTSDISTDRWLAFGLAFVGGFGDAAGFVLAKTFTGHITGSLVLGAIAIAAHNWRDASAHGLATAFFLAGIPLSVLIKGLTLRLPGFVFLPIVMAFELTLITAAYLILACHVGPGLEVFVICLSLALGLQNGAFRSVGGISVHTNYLTGMITGLLAQEAESHAFLPSNSSKTAGREIGLSYGIWGMFFLGAGTGAAMVSSLKERAFLAVVPVLLALIVRSLTAPREPDSRR